GSVIEIYQKHPKSPFGKLRYKSSLSCAANLRALKAAIGKVRVKHIAFDDIASWQDEFADDDGGGKPHKYRAAKLIAELRRIIVFGSLVLPKASGCHDICDIFKKMAEGR